jgi:hypothetical protein
VDLSLDATLLLALASGVAIAAATGLRAFLPLLVVGLAGRFGWIDLQPQVAWLASKPALVALTVATVLEITADKIPALDHALDLVATVVRPLAGWLGAYAVLSSWPEPLAAMVALVLGGGTLGLHLIKAKLRLGTSAVTLGTGNPIVSAAEDATAGTLLLIAILAPVLVLVALALLIWGVARFRRARIARVTEGPRA